MGHSRSAKPYTTLHPHVKHVSESAIRKKWHKLPPTSQEKVKQLLLSLKFQCRANQKNKFSRKGFSAEKKDEEDNILVDEVAQRLLTRLPRMPFPPKSARDEIHFDFEATLDRINILESQLSSTQQSMQLLRIQIAKEEKALKRDKTELESLELGAKSNERLNKERENKLHPVAMDFDMGTGTEDLRNLLNDTVLTNLINLEDTEQLQRIEKQLRSHLESMQNNTACLGPMLQRLEEVQRTIDKFAYYTFSHEQYDEVYG